MADPTDPLDFGLDLGEFQERALAMGYFLSVTDILEATEALDQERGVAARPPAAFVAVSRESAKSIGIISGGHAWRVQVEVSILFVESAVRLDRKNRDQLDRTRKAIIRQFMGWRPRNAGAVLDYEGYRVVSIGRGLAWGEVRFSTEYRLSTDA